MSNENKVLIQHFFEEIYNCGNLHVADELVAADYVNHNPAPGEAPGREGLKSFVAYLRRAFAELQLTIHDQVAEADKVVTRFTIGGVQEGEFAGIPPTVKRFEITAITIHRIERGRIQECWLNWDALAVAQQLDLRHATA